MRQLIDNDWVHLFMLAEDGRCERLYKNQWSSAEAIFTARLAAA